MGFNSGFKGLSWFRYHKDRGRCKQNARGGTPWEAATGKKIEKNVGRKHYYRFATNCLRGCKRD